MKTHSAILILCLSTINAAALNSHKVNQKLDEHNAKLKAAKAQTDAYNAGHASANSTLANSQSHVKADSAHGKELSAIQAHLNAAHAAKGGPQFDALMKAYNDAVENYNKNKKDVYCPNLIPLKDAKPVDPNSPEFHCQQINKICSHYAAYTMLLQSLFDSPANKSFKPEEQFTKGADCLKEKIKKHIIPANEKIPENENKTPKVELSFKAKCCDQAMNDFVNNNNATVIAITDPLEIKVENLKFPDYTVPKAEAQAAIAKAIEQMKANVAAPQGETAGSIPN